MLNATYEPLSVVPSRRAACLVLADKADIIEDDGTHLHSESLSVPNPVVIRLRYVVKVPDHRRTAMSRRAVFVRDEHCCQYCGDLADSIDHIMPRSRGGEHIWENVAAACRPCNLQARPHARRGRDAVARPPRTERTGVDHRVGEPSSGGVEAPISRSPADRCRSANRHAPGTARSIPASCRPANAWPRSSSPVTTLVLGLARTLSRRRARPSHLGIDIVDDDRAGAGVLLWPGSSSGWIRDRPMTCCGATMWVIPCGGWEVVARAWRVRAACRCASHR